MEPDVIGIPFFEAVGFELGCLGQGELVLLRLLYLPTGEGAPHGGRLYSMSAEQALEIGSALIEAGNSASSTTQAAE